MLDVVNEFRASVRDTEVYDVIVMNSELYRTLSQYLKAEDCISPAAPDSLLGVQIVVLDDKAEQIGAIADLLQAGKRVAVMT